MEVSNLEPMTSEDLNFLISRGHAIGAHTTTHANLASIESDSRLHEEIIQCGDKLEDKLGVKIKHFSFGFGNVCFFSKDALKLAKTRYEFIHTGMRGLNKRKGKMTILVTVRNNNVEKAMRVLKKKLQKDGLMKELRRREYYEKPSEKRVRKGRWRALDLMVAAMPQGPSRPARREHITVSVAKTTPSQELGCSSARRCTKGSIVFTRGGALATAPLSAPTVGLEETAAAPNAAPGVKRREGRR